MMEISELSKLFLRLLETPGVGPAKAHEIVRVSLSKGADVSDVLTSSEALETLLTAQQLDAFRGLTAKVDRVADELLRREVGLLNFLEPAYPIQLSSRLGRSAPPLLSYFGELSLLSLPSVGFCGSRKATEKGLAVAADISDQLARKGLNIVSGNAAGVDSAVHKAALVAGGTTTLVLPEGITHFRVKGELGECWNEGKTIAVSQFLPGLPWSARNAMQRNSTICGLSRAVVLIEAGATGGSIAAGREALDLGVPLFAPVYQGMPETATGNRLVLSEGAHPVHRSKKTGRAKVEPILKYAAEGAASGPAESLTRANTSQLAIFSKPPPPVS